MLCQCKDAKDNPAVLFANGVWSERTLRGLEYRPGPPRIFPPVHIHPSAPGTRAGCHIAMSPECHGPDRMLPLPKPQGEEVRPVRCLLWSKGRKVSGVRHGMWDGLCTLPGDGPSLTCLCIGKGPM